MQGTSPGLIEAIDEIWRSQDKHSSAHAGAKNLNDGDITTVVAIDSAVLLGFNHPIISVDRNMGFTTSDQNGQPFCAEIVPGNREPHVAYYSDIDRSLCVDHRSSIFPKFSVSRTIADVLISFQIARDHSDSILLLPQPMRDERLRLMAERTPYTLAQFKLLVINAHFFRNCE